MVDSAKDPADAIRVMLDRLGETPPSRLLYHYTDAKGLEGIIRTRELWATNAAYLNDFQELKHTAALVVEAAQARLRTVEDGPVRRYLSELARSWDDPPTDDVYVFSLSTEGDQLSQWRAYAGRAGYCLGFRPSEWEILEPVAFRMADSPWDVRLVRVKYRQDEQRELVNQFLSTQTAQINPTTILFGSEAAVQTALWTSNLLFSLLAAELKHHSFEEEQEWRIVYAPKLPLRDAPLDRDCIKFRVRASGIVPYAVLPLGEGSANPPVEVVRVGPGLDREPEGAAVRRLLDAYKYAGTHVERSDVPLRTHPLRP